MLYVNKAPDFSTNTPENLSARWWKCDDLALFCNHRTWASCIYKFDHEQLCTLKYSRVKHEAVCWTAEAWLKLGHAAAQ